MTHTDARAQMKTASINDLPDSAFAYIEPGGTKDEQGKTTPRSKRHFPIHDEAHARNALARAPQSPFGDKAMGKIKAACRKFGIEVSEKKSAMTPDIDVVRALAMPVELRAVMADDDGLGALVGYFSTFNVWYPVESKFEGRFLERADEKAYLDTIDRDRSMMKVLFDHGHDPTIGNKVLGPIRDLDSDRSGARFDVPLFDTGYNRELLPGLRAGVYGASMRMHVMEDAWDDKPSRSAHNPDGLPERTIVRARVLEFGPVTFPANPRANVSVRSMTDRYYDQLRHRDTSAYEAACRAASQVIPDLVGQPGARSSGGDETGTEPGKGTASPLHLRQRLDHDALRTRGILR